MHSQRNYSKACSICSKESKKDCDENIRFTGNLFEKRLLNYLKNASKKIVL